VGSLAVPFCGKFVRFPRHQPAGDTRAGRRCPIELGRGPLWSAKPTRPTGNSEVFPVQLSSRKGPTGPPNPLEVTSEPQNRWHFSSKSRIPRASMKIAINTGGGDAPGLNAVIRAIVVSSVARGYEVWGIRSGYRGLIECTPDGLVPLGLDAVRGISHLGGTILGSTNRGDPFNFPVTDENGVTKATDLSGSAIRRFKELGFDCLVALGGDGSVALARRLMDQGLPRVIAVPKTIDNDLPATDVTFGFETAVATATDAVDKLHSTAEAHERVIVVEVMGRYAGWIALHSGIAGGADAILLPEIPFHAEPLCAKIRQRERRGRNFSLVVVAEGARLAGGSMVFRDKKDTFAQHARLGGIGEQVASMIAEGTGKETRTVVLGHLQRGGGPVPMDRLLALRMGTAATRFVAETTESGMVAAKQGEMVLVPFDKLLAGTRTVPPNSSIVQTGRDLGICFGDEDVELFA
jgi:phosphofructokinase-like protein